MMGVSAMSRVVLFAVSAGPAGCRRPVVWLFSGLLAAAAAAGCKHEAKSQYASVAKPQTVRLIRTQIRNIVRVVGQPSFTQSYERSSSTRK